MAEKNSSLTKVIVFAAIVISGSILFLGYQVSSTGSVSDKIIAQKVADVIQGKNTKGKAEANAKTKKLIPVKKEDHIRGPLNAAVTIIEYSDFECPFCKRFHPTVIQMLKKYPKDVNWVYRHFPLEFHDPLSTTQAEASECAAELGGNDSFWAYADKIFERTQSNGRGMEVSALSTIAGEIGLDIGNFDTCLQSGKYKAHIQNDIKEAAAAGVTGTPGNFVIDNKNGKVNSVPGAVPFASLESLVQEILKK